LTCPKPPCLLVFLGGFAFNFSLHNHHHQSFNPKIG
jgi:hypothetical protein